jgi:hypothetical protein
MNIFRRMGERVRPLAIAAAAILLPASMHEAVGIRGWYDAICYGPDGQIKWKARAYNVVATVGKNVALDAYLAGSAYTVVGPFMGLVSSVSFSAYSAADTMASHAGWLEAGGANAPTYTAPRKTVAWSAASAGSKTTSSALSFAITGTGTVKGCFIVYFTGALSTIDNTAGTLYSAGNFTGGDKVVANLDTLSVTYTASM